jgi:hypothetical protein
MKPFCNPRDHPKLLPKPPYKGGTALHLSRHIALFVVYGVRTIL